MAEENKEETKDQKAEGLKVKGLYGYKVGMSSVYSDEGVSIPVTVLRFDQWVVSQVKTVESDGYEALQIASDPKKAKNSNSAEKGHLKAAGFENGARMIKELRQKLPDGVKVGDRIDLSSFEKGEKVKITGTSKGRGFQGVIKRHGFGGGPAAHGSGFHRQPGSIGNRTWPGRVMPGKKMPGHYGTDTVSVKNVVVVDVIGEENVILVKGPVPGARNSLVKLMKV